MAGRRQAASAARTVEAQHRGRGERDRRDALLRSSAKPRSRQLAKRPLVYWSVGGGHRSEPIFGSSTRTIAPHLRMFDPPSVRTFGLFGAPHEESRSGHARVDVMALPGARTRRLRVVRASVVSAMPMLSQTTSARTMTVMTTLWALCTTIPIQALRCRHAPAGSRGSSPVDVKRS